MRKLSIAFVLLFSAFFNANKGAANDKVTICHNNHSITISINALPAHIAHGDDIYACGETVRPASSTEETNTFIW